MAERTWLHGTSDRRAKNQTNAPVASPRARWLARPSRSTRRTIIATAAEAMMKARKRGCMRATVSQKSEGRRQKGEGTKPRARFRKKAWRDPVAVALALRHLTLSLDGRPRLTSYEPAG